MKQVSLPLLFAKYQDGAGYVQHCNLQTYSVEWFLPGQRYLSNAYEYFSVNVHIHMPFVFTAHAFICNVSFIDNKSLSTTILR